MTNYLYVKETLQTASTSLSGDQVWYRAKKRNESLSRQRVSTILNKMLDKGRVTVEQEQVGKRRIKFWAWKDV